VSLSSSLDVLSNLNYVPKPPSQVVIKEDKNKKAVTKISREASPAAFPFPSSLSIP